MCEKLSNMRMCAASGNGKTCRQRLPLELIGGPQYQSPYQDQHNEINCHRPAARVNCGSRPGNPCACATRPATVHRSLEYSLHPAWPLTVEPTSGRLSWLPSPAPAKDHAHQQSPRKSPQQPAGEVKAGECEQRQPQVRCAQLRVRYHGRIPGHYGHCQHAAPMPKPISSQRYTRDIRATANSIMGRRLAKARRSGGPNKGKMERIKGIQRWRHSGPDVGRDDLAATISARPTMHLVVEDVCELVKPTCRLSSRTRIR